MSWLRSTPEAEKPTPRTEQFKSFIRNIGLPSSPVLSKKSSAATLSSQTSLVVATAAITATATTVSVAPSGDRQVKSATGQAAQLPRPLSSKALAVTVSRLQFYSYEIRFILSGFIMLQFLIANINLLGCY